MQICWVPAHVGVDSTPNINESKNQQEQTINWIKTLRYTEIDKIKIG